jgi:hypothetical protein
MTDIPYARELLIQALQSTDAPTKNGLMLDALSKMTRTVTKRGEVKNRCDQHMVAIIKRELAIDDTRQDVEIALACGFPTAAAAARVSEVRNGLR